MLLPLDDKMAATPIRRVLLGRNDLSLSPYICPGAILAFDTSKRSIPPPSAWKNEFDRPIYLVLTREDYRCGWCELDDSGRWIKLVAHPLSRQSDRMWRSKRDIEVLGRAVTAAIRFGG